MKERTDKDINRQERMMEKNLKGRRLTLTVADLKEKEALLSRGQAEVNAANQADDGRIQMIQNTIRVRERLERDRANRERELLQRR